MDERGKLPQCYDRACCRAIAGGRYGSGAREFEDAYEFDIVHHAGYSDSDSDTDSSGSGRGSSRKGGGGGGGISSHMKTTKFSGRDA